MGAKHALLLVSPVACIASLMAVLVAGPLAILSFLGWALVFVLAYAEPWNPHKRPALDLPRKGTKRRG